jgi:5-amino-6-(5-phospho-D-ribitylamino)uracil phosphatase
MEELFTGCKLIAIDIDGTLLTPDGQITPRTRSAIQQAQGMGIVVTLATARRYFNTTAIAAELGIELPLIVYDGALIVSHPTQTILAGQTLQVQVAQQAVEILARHSVQPIVHPYECVLEEVWTGPAEGDNPELATYIAHSAHRIRRTPYEAICNGQTELLRVVAFTSEEAIQALLPEIVALDCSWHMIKRGSYNCAELSIMPPGCSKASGVRTLAAYYHIPLAQVMAIGDNYNDLEMLSTVGWGVAMGQAPEAVQAAAKVVTATNLEEGVALAIENYALAQSTSNEITLLAD